MAVLARGWCLRHPDYVQFQIRRRFVAPDFKAIVEFLKLGVPIGLTFIADVTAFTFMALFIARLGPVGVGRAPDRGEPRGIGFHDSAGDRQCNGGAGRAGRRRGAARAGAAHLCWVGIRLGMAIAVASSLIFWFGAPHHRRALHHRPRRAEGGDAADHAGRFVSSGRCAAGRGGECAARIQDSRWCRC